VHASPQQPLCSTSFSMQAPSTFISPLQPRLRSVGGSRTGSRLVCHALESYIVDKLKASEMTYKELQLRMADPEVRIGCISKLGVWLFQTHAVLHSTGDM